MNHLMLDIETLGTSADAIFLSVAGVQFDPMTGALGEKFYKNVTLSSAIEAGRTINADTLKWWLEQKPDIMKRMFLLPDSLRNVLG